MPNQEERAELHKTIWKIANDLRGSVDGWDFKNYVLGTMFYRYISEDLTAYINRGEEEAGNEGFDYARLSDEDAGEAREDLIQEKGFFIPPGELFENVHGEGLVAGEADALRPAEDHARAHLAHRRAQAVGLHRLAFAEPDQAVRVLVLHVVGDGDAVHSFCCDW